MTSYLDAGRVGIIATIKAHLAANPRNCLIGFGSGSGAWDGAIPAVPRDETELAAPFAYVTPFSIDYALLRSEVVSPGPVPVVIDGVEYEPVLTASPLLMVRALLPSTFASDDDLVIREVGLSLGPTFDVSVTPTQTRFGADEVSDPGQMLIIRRMAPIPHDGSNSGMLAAFLLEI